MKKLLSTLAVSAMLVGSTNANPFADVPAGHWAYNAVNHVVTSGVMKGYRGGMFKGQETVNRYEMAVIISRILAKMEGKTVTTDVRRTMDRLGEEFMDELDLIGARLTALENAFHEHVTEVNNMKMDGGSHDGVKISGTLAHRTEFYQADRPVGATNLGDASNTTFAQGRVNLEKKVDKADFFAQLQQTYTFGNRNGVTNGVDPATTELHQLYAKIYFGDAKEQSLKIGRQTVAFGDEAFIGADEWSLQGRTFDGFTYESKEKDDFSWNAFWFKVNDDQNALNTVATVDPEEDVFGFNLDFKNVGDGDASVFYYQSNGNDMPVPAGLNTFQGQANVAGAVAYPAGVFVGNEDVSIDLWGVNYKLNKDDWHYYFQYAAQGGEFEARGLPVGSQNIDLGGDMLNVKVGYDWDTDKTVALEYTKYSGDNSAGVNSYDGFVPMYGSPHNFLGNADIFQQSNIQDWTLSLNWKNTEKSDWGVAYHIFTKDEADDVTLFGRGMPAYGQTYVNGLAATAGEDDLGNEIDVTYNYKYSKDVDFAFGYSMFNAGDFFTRNNGGYAPDVDFTYFTTAVKF